MFALPEDIVEVILVARVMLMVIKMMMLEVLMTALMTHEWE